jgi:hypothetical protein
MFNPFYLFYFAVLFTASLLSYFSYKKGDRKSFSLFILLFATLLFEVLVFFLSSHKIKYTFTYDIFSSAEYTLFCIYYLQALEVKKNMVFVIMSIVCFFLFSVYAARQVFIDEIKNDDILTLNLNIEGLFLFIMYTHLLFNIDNKTTLPIYKHLDFCISVGVLVFYGGCFVLFGLYPILLRINSITASTDYSFISRPLNIFFYFCIIWGLICFLRDKKYLTRSS